MRLLDVRTLTFTDFHSPSIPKYAIASHRWVAGAEVMLSDVQEGKKTVSYGYDKVKSFAEYVRVHIPDVKWLWIDTCCIDQRSSAELSEAINSMFRWYREAEVCLAYLQDVATTEDLASFDRSNWFSRGWTLQELLAPSVVVFLTQKWQVIGHKGRGDGGRSSTPVQTGPLLNGRIATVTRIPEIILQDYRNSRTLGLEEKLQWARHRQTTREEDHSYCLLGILGVSMNIRYGDGRETTRARLLKKARICAYERAEGELSDSASLASLAAQLVEHGRKVGLLYNSLREAPTILEDIASELGVFGHALHDLERDRQRYAHNPEESVTLERCVSMADRANSQIRSAIHKLDALVQTSKAGDWMDTSSTQSEVLHLCNTLDRAKCSLAFAYQLYTESRRKADTGLLFRMLNNPGLEMPPQSIAFDPQRHDVQHTNANLLAQYQAAFHTSGLTSGLNHGTYKHVPEKPAFEIVRYPPPMTHRRSKQKESQGSWRLQCSPWFTSRIWELSLKTAQTGWTFKLWTSNLVPENALILEACRDGNLAEVQRLFSEGTASPYDCCSDGISYYLGNTTLAAAAFSGNVQLCQYLINTAAYPMTLESTRVPLDLYLENQSHAETETPDMADMYRLLLDHSEQHYDIDNLVPFYITDSWWTSCPGSSCLRLLKANFSTPFDCLPWETQVHLALEGSMFQNATMPARFLEILGAPRIDSRVASAQNQYGETALHMVALQLSNLDELKVDTPVAWINFVRNLVNSGADLHHLYRIQHDRPRTPFMSGISAFNRPISEVQRWLKLLEAADIDLNLYGRRESAIWKAVYPSGYEYSRSRVEILTYGPKVQDWTFDARFENLVRTYKLDYPPGAWNDCEKYQIKTICWSPQRQELEDQWPWKATGDSILLSRHSTNDVEHSDNHSPGHNALAAWVLGPQDDCGAIIRLIQQSSRLPYRPRRCSDPLIKMKNQSLYDNSTMRPWVPQYHYCPFDAKFRFNFGDSGKYTNIFGELRDCLKGIHSFDAGSLWDSMEGISRQMRGFRRRYRDLSELRSLPYDAYHPKWRGKNDSQSSRT